MAPAVVLMMVLVMATAEALAVMLEAMLVLVLTKVAMVAMLEAMPVLVLAKIPMMRRRLARVPTVLVAGSHGGHGGFHGGRVKVAVGMMAVMGMVVTRKKVVLCLQECIY